MHRFYAAKKNFGDGRIRLEADETRHLRDVLRLRIGDQASVFDGEGNEFLTEIETIGKSGAELKILETVTPASPESTLDLTLAVAMLKGEKFDLVVQKTVELGVSKLIPLQTVRCDVTSKGADNRVERWRKIALEASKQSGRAKLMSIESPIDFSKFIVSYSEEVLMFTERSGESFSKVKASKKITAMIGPEGGWEDSEIEQAKSRGALLITLGGRILRAETAAISVAAILQHRFGDLS
jgi:16S rRNA (uracil1498-N3)-methyltransferase